MTPLAANPTRILILGGGFAGINAMLTLEKLLAEEPNIEIVLISRENFFLFTPMLSEVAIGVVDPRHIVTPIRELCGKTIFYRAEVTSIDLQHQLVGVRYNNVPGCEELLSYDHLILALGSESNVTLVPGVDKYAYRFKELGDALVLRNHILEMFERADTALDPAHKRAMLSFAIIGGGYSGVEIAAAIQDMAHRIHTLYTTISPTDIQVVLIEAGPRILATMPQELGNYALEQLEDMGITVLTNTKVEEVAPSGVTLSNGKILTTHTPVWTTGSVIPGIIKALPVTKDKRGQPLNTPELRLEGYETVWAVGDNALTPQPPDVGGFYPPTAQIAIPQGQHVAQNLYKVLKGETPEPFVYKVKGEMVVLGERSAVALVYGKKIKGVIAWLMWRFYYLSRLPRWKKKTRVAVDWLLTFLGPLETTELKVSPRAEPCDIEDTACLRGNLSERS